MTPDPTPREASAVQALARASRVLERASSELSLADFRVLSAIAAGEARASRVAEKLAIGKPTISAAVDSLTRRGLLQRSQVRGDLRGASLALTDEGTRVRDAAEAAMVERVRTLCASTPDAARMLEALAWLDQAIEAGVAGRQAVTA